MPVIHNKTGKVDQHIIEQAKEHFAQALFDAVIFIRQRITYCAICGITNNHKGCWNVEVLGQYETLGKEMIERIKDIEGEDE